MKRSYAYLINGVVIFFAWLVSDVFNMNKLVCMVGFMDVGMGIIQGTLDFSKFLHMLKNLNDVSSSCHSCLTGIFKANKGSIKHKLHVL